MDFVSILVGEWIFKPMEKAMRVILIGHLGRIWHGEKEKAPTRSH